jgi:hypothetical protein
MSLTVQSLIQIASAGGSLIIDCKGYTVPSLESVVKASNGKGTTITLTNTSGFTVPSLVSLVSAGKGNVIIDTRASI